MLFDKQTYIERRRVLTRRINSGIILFMGNNLSPMNYPNNTYKFRQDSSFLYYFGLHREGLVGVIDADEGREYLLGDDIDIEDIVWYGSVESVADLAAQTGIANSAPMAQLKVLVDKAIAQGRKVHFLPPYRHDLMIQLLVNNGLYQFHGCR